MAKPLAKRLGNSIIESKIANGHVFGDTDSSLARAPVFIGGDTAITKAEDLRAFIGGNPAPVVVRAATISCDEPQDLVVCAVNVREYNFLRRWARLEYGPEIRFGGENVHCVRIKGWKTPTQVEAEFASTSPLSNPKVWDDASKAFAAGHRRVLASLPLVVEDYDQTIPPEQLQALFDCQSAPDTFRIMTVPRGDWDDAPPREIVVHVLDAREELLVYSHTETDPDAPSVILEGKKLGCVKIKAWKSAV